MCRRPFLIFAAILVLGAGNAFAQSGLTGTWTLQATVQLPDQVGTCAYSGQTSITQTGATIHGFAELFIVSGPDSCPAEMSADLDGALDAGQGSTFVSGSLSGPLGLTAFRGQLSPNPGGSGNFNVSQGAFAGSVGTWAAQFLPGSIPDLTPTGLTLLTLLLLASGYWFLARKTA